jgi:thermitase
MPTASRHLSATVRRRFGRAALTAVALAATLATLPAVAQDPASAETAYAPGRILLMPRAGLPAAALDRILKEDGGSARRVGKSELRIVDLPRGLERRAVERLSRHPHIKFAELDRLLPPSAAPNDPYLGSQWHLGTIGATTAWDLALGSGVTIAILDTGVDGAHADLAGRMVPGWNAYDNNSNSADVHGHGTAVAGAAAATMNNGLGVASVAGQSRIMPIRISDPTGWATWSTVAQGLTWATDRGARVANISYGGVSASSAVQSAAQRLKNLGGLVVVAAGNNGIAEGYAPTSTMITVSATTSSDVLASWSSYGNFISVAAPGDGIWTTKRGGSYGSWWGTSFSSPVTAGVVSLMMSANPSLSAADVESLLFSSAVDLGTSGWDTRYGWGRVDAQAAVTAALIAVPVADTVPPSVAISAPLGSQTVSGLVPVDVAATDNKGVARVDLRVNGQTVASDSSAPFAISWDSTQVANGSTGLTAVAVDAAGNSATSALVTVNVANAAKVDTSAPVVLIGDPREGATVTPKMTVKASASDDSGAAGIRLSLAIDGQTVLSTTGGTLSYNWNTRKLSAGTHTVKVTAQDAAGNQSSQTVNVRK